MQGRPRYFSTFDLIWGFNQILMGEDSKEKTAFVTHHGHFQYNRMPFGLCNAPATFQRAMNEVFKGLIGKGVYVYIDDITCYSETFDQHMKLLRAVMERLCRYDLFLKPKKCTIATHEAELLGHVITAEGIKPAPSKIQAVTEYPRPNNKTELHAFLGLINYYRNFVKGCSKITAPLTHLLQETVKFEWSQHAEETFEKIKSLLTSDLILARPDFDEPFILHTDGSSLGLGAVLSQRIDGKERPVAYASRRTSRTEANYGSTQIEFLAVVWATKKFRHYLIGAPFKLITDHSALRHIFNMEQPSSLFARWIMKLAEFDIDVVVKPGKQITNADALSRTPHRSSSATFVFRLPKRGQFLAN